MTSIAGAWRPIGRGDPLAANDPPIALTLGGASVISTVTPPRVYRVGDAWRHMGIRPAPPHDRAARLGQQAQPQGGVRKGGVPERAVEGLIPFSLSE